MEFPAGKKLHIYVITNTLNDKQYVGVTTRPKGRFGEHCKIGFKGRTLTDAILADGRSNFTFRIVEAVDDVQEALKLEAFLIKGLNSVYPNGYNRQAKGITCDDTRAKKSLVSSRPRKKK